MSLGPINLAPVLSGYVADKYGWRTNFWILTAFTALNLLLVVFGCPETRYHRPPSYETDLAVGDNRLGSYTEDSYPSPDLEIHKQPRTDEIEEITTARTYWQELKPFTYIDRSSNPVTHVTRVFTCIFYPAVIWCFLVGSTYSGWVSLLLFVLIPAVSLTQTPVQRLEHHSCPDLLYTSYILHSESTRTPQHLSGRGRILRLCCAQSLSR